MNQQTLIDGFSLQSMSRPARLTALKFCADRAIEVANRQPDEGEDDPEPDPEVRFWEHLALLLNREQSEAFNPRELPDEVLRVLVRAIQPDAMTAGGVREFFAWIRRNLELDLKAREQERRLLEAEYGN